jgi:hypothetical protein
MGKFFYFHKEAFEGMVIRQLVPTKFWADWQLDGLIVNYNAADNLDEIVEGNTSYLMNRTICKQMGRQCYLQECL